MTRLPEGTVTLMFSDIDGSTQLLSRLGPTYVHAMDAQREVIRSATTSHGGREMGTEGDSFFVAFPTAPAAVAAASEAQRALETYAWPMGERVRVRMGIHTGNPTIHRGGYLGMDVHRAARIANAAHGGQVVLSDTTAHLVVGGGLPQGAQLRDLGTHRLKDLPAPEHLFQLRLPGLQSEFAPLRSLGAASSLPVTAAPMIGRDAHLQEISTLLNSGEVRLMTLTGPGGAGKTRLAIALAGRLLEWFPDGVYFVPLAAVSAPDQMWTTIAEVLGVPQEMRTPLAMFDYISPRHALVILDNLEQINDADSVVATLLDRARRVSVVATSRRPLHIAGEHEYVVEPLDLPTGDGLAEVERAPAAQLFVQQAGSVRSSFVLSEANAADVAAICRRLDGLPLAIELAAARTKVLSPHALLARLDRALDLAAVSTQGPSRQRTLRDTIDWSYNLLAPPLQKLFRRLGVFVGGADLDAVSALTSEDADLGAADPLDLVASLVDASLVIVSESADGEPRVGVLKTMRAYALDQLAATGEEQEVRVVHAKHYLGVAEGLSRLLDSDRDQEARARFDVEIDNFREALGWATTTVRSTDGEDPALLALRLFAALAGLWSAGGGFPEERSWGERVIANASGQDSPELARALSQVARAFSLTGDLESAAKRARSGFEMFRRLGDTSTNVVRALEILADVEAQLGDTDAARAHFSEALAVGRSVGRNATLLSLLLCFAIFVGDSEGDIEAAYKLEQEAVEIGQEVEAVAFLSRARQNLACSLRLLGRAEEARDQMRALVAECIRIGRPLWLCELAEDYAAVLAELGECAVATRLFGAADRRRSELGTPMTTAQVAEIADSLAKARASLSPSEWAAAFSLGQGMEIHDALTSVEVD